jgi:hypothetical protein
MSAQYNITGRKCFPHQSARRTPGLFCEPDIILEFGDLTQGNAPLVWLHAGAIRPHAVHVEFFYWRGAPSEATLCVMQRERERGAAAAAAAEERAPDMFRTPVRILTSFIPT